MHVNGTEKDRDLAGRDMATAQQEPASRGFFVVHLNIFEGIPSCKEESKVKDCSKNDFQYEG